MKIRQGFVSNSSSASFTIRWRFNGEETDLRKILEEIFQFDYRTATTYQDRVREDGEFCLLDAIEDGTKEVTPDGEKKRAERLPGEHPLKQTNFLAPVGGFRAEERERTGTEFVSHFWTCMLNCYGDLGQAAEALFFYLNLTRQTEIIDFHVEEDH